MGRGEKKMLGLNIILIIGGLIVLRIVLKRAGLLDDTKEGNLRARNAGREGKMGLGLSMDNNDDD